MFTNSNHCYLKADSLKQRALRARRIRLLHGLAVLTMASGKRFRCWFATRQATASVGDPERNQQ